MNKIIQDLKTQFSADYKNNPFTLFLEAIGTVTCLVASASLAFFAANANLLFILIAYFVGSVLWIVAAKLRNNSFLLVLNVAYAAINLFGIIKLLVS